jgi:hypothetical protein
LVPWIVPELTAQSPTGEVENSFPPLRVTRKPLLTCRQQDSQQAAGFVIVVALNTRDIRMRTGPVASPLNQVAFAGTRADLHPLTGGWCKFWLLFSPCESTTTHESCMQPGLFGPPLVRSCGGNWEPPPSTVFVEIPLHRPARLQILALQPHPPPQPYRACIDRPHPIYKHPNAYLASGDSLPCAFRCRFAFLRRPLPHSTFERQRGMLTTHAQSTSSHARTEVPKQLARLLLQTTTHGPSHHHARRSLLPFFATRLRACRPCLVIRAPFLQHGQLPSRGSVTKHRTPSVAAWSSSSLRPRLELSSCRHT